MIEITKKLPITLIELLNLYNEELTDFRREIKVDSSTSEVTISSTKYEKINIRYTLKATGFYFDLNFTAKKDYIDWTYYPHTQSSTTSKNKTTTVISQPVYSQLKVALMNWKNLITNVSNLKNPLEYFDLDNFIEFYSGEVLEQIPTTEEEEKYPLSSAKRNIAIELINKQSKFIKKEISSIKDVNSDKYYDLLLAERNLQELKEDLPRMTVAEVKRKWSISLGVIIKWCSDKFIKFTKIDEISGNDISRTIGSFIGGVFGIPKIDQ